MTKTNTGRRIVLLSLMIMLALGNITTLPAAPKDKAAAALAVPVVGTVTGTIAGTFTGTANITQFAVNSVGQLVAVGTLTGVVRDATGAVVQSIASTFSVPITSPIQAACEILNLQLGPIHLDLLGLVIDTNRIVVNITAVPGAGNLLGNLLCAVANLLNGGVNLQGLANLLNDILAAL